MHPRIARPILLSAFLVSMTASAWADLPLKQIKDETLRVKYRQVGLQVMFNDSLRAMVNANSLGWEVFHLGQPGKNRELSYALALQAAAEMNLQMNREALWHWEAAQILLPELHSEMMQSYSEVAKIFDSTPFRNHESAVAHLREEGTLVEDTSDGSQPRSIETIAAVTPRRKPSALTGQKVSVSYLVSPEGQPQAPKVHQGKHSDLAVFTVLQALMSWRYEPARLDGEPAWAVVTSDFSFQKER